MIDELAVSNLGVIESANIVFGPGMTALTGETGAGKTMLVQAIEILLGGRADGALVREGAQEAVVEGRFSADDDDEIVLRRVVPRKGRTRAYIDGHLATVAELSAIGDGLIAIHGQHTHRLLTEVAEQRGALDRFGAIDLTELTEAEAALRAIDARLADVGGDLHERAREIDLLTYQTDELAAAAIAGPYEDAQLEAEEDLLAAANDHREAAAAFVESLVSEGGVLDRIRIARAGLGERAPFRDEMARLDSALVEVDDVVSLVRERAEVIVEDSERLSEVRERRRLLFELRRKYGDTLAEVIAFEQQARGRLDELRSHDVLAEQLQSDRARALESLSAVQASVRSAREAAAPRLCRAIEARLASLAMGRAKLDVALDGADGGELAFLLAANSGATPKPIAKVASGGELARTMLAVELEVNAGPETLIFDEVDAGVGGETGLAVGAALAEVAVDKQVLVVTHLAQVAAHADHQVAIRKSDDGKRAIAEIASLSLDDRVGELSRMLGGDVASDSGRRHAKELLELSGGR